MPGAQGESAVEQTDVGSYFVANYPPFSTWKPEFVAYAVDALDQPPRVNRALGLYLHIPFCRKRCHFCYFRVYTDKNARISASFDFKAPLHFQDQFEVRTTIANVTRSTIQWAHEVRRGEVVIGSGTVTAV